MAAHSSYNDSFHHPNLSSINADFSFLICLISRPSYFIYTTFFITNILLLLPLCILILKHGLQKQWRSTSNFPATMINHSDSFTYHMVAMELIGVFGFILCCCGIYKSYVNVLSVGSNLWTFTWFGETFFHTLTCVERYLAVVHPVTYLSLKSERGVRIRSISIGCGWLICSGVTILSIFKKVRPGIDVFFLTVSWVVISFCSLSVVCVLIRPGPGHRDGDRNRVDQSKQRAFYTIVAILGVLFMRFCWNLTLSVLYTLRIRPCMMMSFGEWLNIPGSLVLPLLFLHRAGILACGRKTRTERGLT